jgi:DNA-binding transcriptional regulator YiaG
MSYKTAIKSKGKASNPNFAAAGKKPIGLKSVPFRKGGKPHGLHQKAEIAAGKKPVTYLSKMPPAAQIHDAGYGMEYAVAEAAASETTPLERETELANELVAEVADGSADVNELCETYELKREELGRLTGFSLRALAEWASGKLPSQPAKRRLQEVRRLLDALAQIVKPESIPTWLHQRNSAFDHLTPLQVIEFGEIDRLWAMVHDLASGQPE